MNPDPHGRARDEAAPRAFYAREGEHYRALAPATGPWDRRFQTGMAVSGLLAHALDQEAVGEPMEIVRFHLDIIRPAPMDRPIQLASEVVRTGRRLRISDVRLTADGDLMARATAVRMRAIESPDLAPGDPPPAPEGIDAPPMSERRTMRGVLQSKLLYGGLEALGPGKAWYRFDGDIVEGEPITPFVAAAMVSDLGSGLSSVLPWRRYTFANIDISLHLTRPPRDNWILAEAETVTHGGGRALVNTVLSDRQGDFARAHQTLFVDPRP